MSQSLMPALQALMLDERPRLRLICIRGVYVHFDRRVLYQFLNFSVSSGGLSLRNQLVVLDD